MVFGLPEMVFGPPETVIGPPETVIGLSETAFGLPETVFELPKLAKNDARAQKTSFFRGTGKTQLLLDFFHPRRSVCCFNYRFRTYRNRFNYLGHIV